MKPKVLFITERYCFVDNPANGSTNALHNIIGSWECADLGPYKHLQISKEPGDLWGGESIDHALTTEKFDLAFLTSYEHTCCSYEVAAKLGKRLILGWWDSILAPLGNDNVAPGERWWEYAERNTVNVVFDQGLGEMYKNTWAFETPQDTRLYKPDSSIKEDIDVSLVGAIRQDRFEILNILADAGISAWAGGGRAMWDSPHPNLPIEEYVKIHQRSKICLNPQISHGRPGRKGRGFEIAACRKFMLANHKEALDGYLEPGVHYADFDNGNLVERVSYYLDHPKERKQIAKQAYNKYQESYTPTSFWNRVIALTSF